MYKENIMLEESEKFINSSKLIVNEKEVNGIKISTIDIDNKTSKLIGKNKGKYITISFDKDNIASKIETLVEVISLSLKSEIEYLKLSTKAKVLFLGLGNKEITSDKFGYSCIEKIVVNKNTYKIYKDVLGVTNIDSFYFTKAITDITNADLVIIFDSLKAEHLERLGNTIQISSGGLTPGSAIQNNKKEISKKTLKRNVICIGVPTIINMKNIENSNIDLLITTKDIDKIVDDLSSLISISLNRIF